MAETDPVIIRIIASQKDLQASLAASVRATERAAKAAENAFKGANDNMSRNWSKTLKGMDTQTESFASKLKDSLSKVVSGPNFGAFAAGAGTALAGAFSVDAILQFIDANTKLQNSLKTTGLQGKELEDVYQQLKAAALQNGVPVNALGELYAKLSLTQKELGISSQQLIEFTKNIAGNLRAGGVDAGQASGALLQLSQSLGSGTVRAEEFNSVLEGAPTIIQAAANGLAAAGGSVAKLRALVISGAVSSREFFDAIQTGSASIQARAAGSALTIAQAFTNLNTTLQDTVKQFDSITGASSGVAEFIGKDLPKVISDLSKALAVVAGALVQILSLANKTEGGLTNFFNNLGRAMNLPDLGPWAEKTFGADNVRALNESTGALKTYTEAWRTYQATLTASTDTARTGVDNLANDLRTLQGALSSAGDTTNLGAINTAFETLNEHIDAGTATAGDFDTAIDALHAAGTKMGDDLAGKLALVKNSFTQVADEATNKTQKALEELGKVGSDMITEWIAGFGDKLPTAVQQFIASLKQGLAVMQQMQQTQLDPLGVFGPGAAGVPTGQTAVEGGLRAQPTATEAKAYLSALGANAKIQQRVNDLNDDFAVRLAQLLRQFPKLRINSAFRTYDEQAAAFAAYKAGRGGLAAPPGTSRHESGRAVDLNIRVLNPEELKAFQAAAANLGIEPLKGRAYLQDKVHYQDVRGHGAAAPGEPRQRAPEEQEADRAAEEATRQAEARAKKAAEGQKAYSDLIDEQKKAIDQQLYENQVNTDASKTIDQQTLTIEANREARKLNDEAVKNGITLTEELKQKHLELGMAMAQAKLGADAIKQGHEDAKKAAEDHKKALEDLAQQIGQIAQTAISGFVNDLRNGVDAGEAFANMINRITDSMINMAIESLFSKNALGGVFSNLFGSLGGVGAGAGSFAANSTGGLYHGGGTVGMSGRHDGRHFPPALWANAPHFQRGGIVGLRAGEVPIIAHAGELVIPRGMTARGGAGRVDNSVHQENRIAIDMSGTGMVAANSKDAKQVGENIQLLIQAELVRQSRPGGLLRKVPA